MPWSNLYELRSLQPGLCRFYRLKNLSYYQLLVVLWYYVLLLFDGGEDFIDAMDVAKHLDLDFELLASAQIALAFHLHYNGL